MAQRFKGKVALVAGAGSAGPGWGNGKAAAVLYAREGAAVFCVDIDRKAAEETRDIILSEGGNATAHAADVSKNAAVEAMVAACLAAHGRIDVLHNNVGIVEHGNVVEASEESWDRVHDINLKSVFLACKHVIPHMVRQGKGAIVNIASTAGLRHMGMSYCSYSATKSAILHLTRAMAMDHARQGIRVNSVVPGVIHTPLVESVYAAAGQGERERLLKLRAEQVPLGRLGDAWDVAQAAAFLASDDAKYITGTELVVDGGLIVKAI
ncbi:MAG: SDR family oxidoreductase [Alphaproteobacteria bacterium]|nr:SDR family oxidoreductase [Alphaproteobacteria bacterium]